MKKNHKKMLLILDDLISAGINMRNGIIANLYTSFRHCDISVFFLTQNIMYMSP